MPDDVSISLDDDHVATVEIRRPPNNYFDVALIAALADAFGALSGDPGCRVIVLCAQGKHFCAGADFSGASTDRLGSITELYDEAARLFATELPIVAAVQGGAIGGGLGLALVADFRVAAPEARFSANFARIGIHQGFGLTITLPALVGQQCAMDMLYTGRRVAGEEALQLGLCDRVVPAEQLRTAAHGLAAEIAASAPLAVRAIRRSLRVGLVEAVRAATALEHKEQAALIKTEDFVEGVRSTADRRPPRFTGR